MLGVDRVFTALADMITALVFTLRELLCLENTLTGVTIPAPVAGGYMLLHARRISTKFFAEGTT